MGFFKVLACVAGGVAAVVAAPVLLPAAGVAAAAAGAVGAAGAAAAAGAVGAAGAAAAAGAATVVGAVAAVDVATVATVAAAGAAGAAVAKGASEAHRKNEQRRNEELEEAMRAGAAMTEEKYKEQIDALMAKLGQHKDLEKHIAAMFALGVAVANVDGEICDSEKADIEEFIAGAMAARLPDDLLADIRAMYQSPPSVEQALQYIKKAGVPRESVEELIYLVVNSDGVVTEEERAFKENWERYASGGAA